MLDPQYDTLIIGDPNFSFSHSLVVEKWRTLDNLLVIASEDTRKYLFSTYREAKANLRDLHAFRRRPLLRYEIDYRRLSETLDVHWTHRFQRIIWNYPIAKSTANIRENQRLLLDFLAGASVFLHSKGEIHIRLCNYQSEDWDLPKLLHETCLRVAAIEPWNPTEEFPHYQRVTTYEDKEWSLYPNSERTFIIVPRDEDISEENTARRLLKMRWRSIQPGLHVECNNRKRKRHDEEHHHHHHYYVHHVRS